MKVETVESNIGYVHVRSVMRIISHRYRREQDPSLV